MVIEFLIERDSPLTIGQKITGRQGNKGVVSKILPDDEMPFTENGERIEVLLNALGVVNRLNSMQIYELSINFICSRVVERLKTLKSLKEKEELLFDIINRFNDEEAEKLKEYYGELKTKEKNKFFDDIYENGIYIHMRPFWEKTPIFDILTGIYKDYEWIKPIDVYVNRYGRKIKIMKPLIVGDLYMMKLKQSSKKGFSARSTGALSKRGVPEKSFKTKQHQDLYSSTPIRIGDQENINSLIGVEPVDIATLHLYYRSSPIGRREVGKQLASTIKPLKDFDRNPDFKNRNVEILQAYLKAMGLKIEFLGETYDINVKTNRVESYSTDEGLLIATQGEYEDYELKKKIHKKYKDNVCFVGTNEEYDELFEKEFNDEKDRKRCYTIDIT